MKTKLAKEKSEYAHCLGILMNDKLDWDERDNALQRIKELEKYVVEKYDDGLFFIVTSKKTYEGKCAPPMTMDDIKKK